mgnify:CR=1 FL=1|jgi:hypothetical protein
MKKYLFTILIILSLLLSGCSQCISTETKTVDVRIVGETYKVERKLSTIDESEELIVKETYAVTVQYNGRKYSVDGEDVYNQFKDCVGDRVKGILEIRTYENGYKAKSIISLKSS